MLSNNSTIMQIVVALSNLAPADLFTIEVKKILKQRDEIKQKPFYNQE